MARGKSYSKEELMLIHAMRRYEENGNCTYEEAVTNLAMVCDRTEPAIRSQLSRMKPVRNWGPIDRILNDPEQNEPLTSENVQDFIGTVHKVKCDAITTYGAFCHTLDTNVKGLLHISRISMDYVTDIQDHLKLNDEFYVTIADESVAGKVSFSRLDVPEELRGIQ